MCVSLFIYPPQPKTRVSKQITKIFLLFAFCNTLKETVSSAISVATS